MKKKSGLDIMNEAADVVQKKHSLMGQKKKAPMPDEEALDDDMDDASPAKKKSSKQVAAMKEKMKDKGLA